ncbi:MAG TPA: GAF domain-containing protein [Planctomycetes bacterium]|nr:GAF domain-containing protein [Planctomycetota bacterium]
MKLVVVEDGTRSNLEFDRGVIRIGRAIDNDIRLSGPLTSRHHCRIDIHDDWAELVDLASANGTRRNGRIVDRAALFVGDVIAVGGARLHVEELSLTPTRGGETQRIDASADEPAEDQEGVASGLATLSDAARAEHTTLKVFARITHDLVGETDLAVLLRRIVDAAVHLVGGERGFLLLDTQNTGREPKDWKVRVARNFDHSDIPVPSSRLSMGIAKRVLEEGNALLSVDAGRDERLSAMASVEDLRLRSVMCLPVGTDEEVLGLLYVDNRLQEGAFTQDDLDLAELFADQAAIAIKNARLVQELRARNEKLVRSSEQIRSLNERLGRKVQDRDRELSVVRRELDRERGRYDYSAIVGASDEMKRVFRELDRIIETSLPVLVQGESGTGKELIARAIHFNGARKERPFVAENCAALPDTLLESELFGHVRGAFTGADRSKKGLLEQADGGTLFLDEIGDMSQEMQKKLLRVLQEGEVRPVGSSVTSKVDVRLLAASHRDLEELVRRGEFREDLFYRINVLTLRLPPLRERREDIPLLAEALLARAAREAGCQPPHLSHEVLTTLCAHDWPGNVRELENEMRRALLLAEESVLLEHLSPGIREAESKGSEPSTPVIVGDLRAAVTRFERGAIRGALERNEWNKSRAARELGISRFALQRKLEKYGIDRPEDADTVPGEA